MMNLLQSYLTLLWTRSLSYGNQSIDLQSKSMDWFLHDRDLRHERVKVIYTKILMISEKVFTTKSWLLSNIVQKVKFFNKDFFSKYDKPDLFTLTKEILNGKIQFLCCVVFTKTGWFQEFLCFLPFEKLL